MKSIDQGNTWSCSNISGGRLFDVQFLNQEKGFILAGGHGWHFGNGSLFKTEDAGVTWDLIYYYDDAWLSSCLFLNDSLGFLTRAVVNCSTSSDGGYSWTGDTTMYGVYDLCLANDSTCWAFSSGWGDAAAGIYFANKGSNEWNLYHASDTLSFILVQSIF